MYACVCVYLGEWRVCVGWLGGSGLYVVLGGVILCCWELQVPYFGTSPSPLHPLLRSPLVPLLPPAVSPHLSRPRRSPTRT